MAANLTPAFITLHGNRLEELRHKVFAWIRDNPLGPLEEETFLVQSNGVADWLKIALAEESGVCAATRVMLPARFLWQAYRAVLGTDTIAPASPFDREPLVWRLMQLLPAIIAREEFAPLRHFLSDDDPERRLQLAQRIAGLMDQYQVYRADWLEQWANGNDVVLPAAGEAVRLAPDQSWQAQLWREILGSMRHEDGVGRGGVHAQFMSMLAADCAPAGRLQRRVILFGISALPQQTVEALGALSKRMQVIVAVPNPCRYYWADVISGAELLRAAHKRQPYRNAIDISGQPAELLHAQCHPLLAGWGRLGRDFVRMLDAFDDAGAAIGFEAVRLDLFSEGEGDSMLTQLQADIRDMAPSPAPNARRQRRRDDKSIAFHVGHSVQRELEILHDRLLDVLAGEGGPGPAMRPRDIIVMVPDVAAFAPAIQAVFGQYREHDPRHIPFAIVDVGQRRRNPMVVALEWLLRLPQQRCLQTEVRDLLDVPAVAERFGIRAADLPGLAKWIEQSTIRWGLDQAHRDGLGLGPAGEQNAWLFGVRRMLMGYACGDASEYAGVVPFAEVGGLDAGLAGALSRFVECLIAWRQTLQASFTPKDWAAQGRRLVEAFFKQTGDVDRAMLAKLHLALGRWQDHCALGGFAHPVPLAVFREAWLDCIDESPAQQRFISGGVTFCTMMPMRAVPYQMVCLLGMNEGEFPRRAPRADFDLLALPGMQRPGDRSRRDDDRYLMLEAVLSARRYLYVSWVGRNVRDNTVEPPSVLVAQLRDCLLAGWEVSAAELVTTYPLQPFSRCYFEAASGAPDASADRPLRTHAHEWWTAHAGKPREPLPMPVWTPDPGRQLTLRDLASFMNQPVDYFYQQRLQVYFGKSGESVGDDEVFALDPLQSYQAALHLLADDGPHEADARVNDRLRARAALLAGEGRLPVGLLGLAAQDKLVRELAPARRAWLELHRASPHRREPLPVKIAYADGTAIVDWLDGLIVQDPGATAFSWCELSASRLLDEKPTQPRAKTLNALRTRLRAGLPQLGSVTDIPRLEKLISCWLRQLAGAAQGYVMTGSIVGRDALVTLHPVPADRARAMLDEVVACWKAGLSELLPVACSTAIALVQNGKPDQAYDGATGPHALPGRAERDKHAALARHWPDYEALEKEPEWPAWAARLYQPLADWACAFVDVTPHAADASSLEEAA